MYFRASFHLNVGIRNSSGYIFNLWSYVVHKICLNMNHILLNNANYLDVKRFVRKFPEVISFSLCNGGRLTAPKSQINSLNILVLAITQNITTGVYVLDWNLVPIKIS